MNALGALRRLFQLSEVFGLICRCSVWLSAAMLGVHRPSECTWGRFHSSGRIRAMTASPLLIQRISATLLVALAPALLASLGCMVDRQGQPLQALPNHPGHAFAQLLGLRNPNHGDCGCGEASCGAPCETCGPPPGECGDAPCQCDECCPSCECDSYEGEPCECDPMCEEPGACTGCEGASCPLPNPLSCVAYGPVPPSYGPPEMPPPARFFPVPTRPVFAPSTW